MIAQLRGKVESVGKNWLVVDCGGVGYGVSVPQRICDEAGEPGREIRLFTQLVIRDEQMSLYGFSTSCEREFFNLLLGVSGVGPRTALNILSAFDVPELARMLLRGDEKAILRIPGIGKKTAQRLILELQEKVGLMFPSRDGVEKRVRGVEEEVREVLESLGCNPSESKQVMACAVKIAGEGAGFDLLLMESLRLLGEKR